MSEQLSPQMHWAKAAGGPLLLVAFGIIGYLYADIDVGPPPPGQLGPAFWPKVCFAGIAVAAAFKTFQVLKEHSKLVAQAGREALKAMDNRKLAVMIALIILVVPAIEYLGFPIASILFFYVFMRVAGEKKLVRLWSISIIGTVALLYLFVKVVYIPLPRGEWVFDELTLFIYRILFIQ